MTEIETRNRATPPTTNRTITTTRTILQSVQLANKDTNKFCQTSHSPPKRGGMICLTKVRTNNLNKEANERKREREAKDREIIREEKKNVQKMQVKQVIALLFWRTDRIKIGHFQAKRKRTTLKKIVEEETLKKERERKVIINRKTNINKDKATSRQTISK